MTSTLLAVTFDCEDAATLASFWATVLDRPVDTDASADFASIGMASAGSETAWLFVKVPEGASAKNRCHPDMVSSDLDAESVRLVAAGATQHGTISEGGHRWTTFTDPEGNVFDVVQGAPQP